MTIIYCNPGDNIAEAGAALKSGDSLIFRAGFHYGQFTVPVDEVTISGEPGAILEGTEAVPNQWEEATQSDDYISLAGTGTWRVALPSQPWVLLDSEGSMIHRLDSDFVGVKETLGYYYMTAYEALAVPDNARPGQDYGADWWEGIEALWVWNPSDQHLYVRYRAGDKPDKLRYSGGRSDHRQPPLQAGSVIYVEGRSNIRIENLGISGCVDGVAVVDSRNVVIDSCMFSGCDFGVRVYGVSEDIKVNHCEFDITLLGTNAVAPVSKISTENPCPESRFIVYHQYAMWKFWHDLSDSTQGAGLAIYNSWNESTQTIGVPKRIEFGWNNVKHHAFAVDCFGGDGIDIHDNEVRNNWDMAFQRSPDGGRNVSVHDNEVHESGYCLMRWHAANQDAGDNYFYNNRCSDIDQVTDFIYLARHSGHGDSHSNLRINIYHNSFSGGNTIAIMDGMLSMPGFNAVNNVVSNGGMTSVASGWPSDIGVVDYNFVTGQSGRSAAALGAPIKRRDGTLFTLKPTKNLQAASGPIWPSDEIEEGFVLPAGHPAKSAGIDVSQPFVIDGRTYQPLPGFEPGYFSGTAPDMGWINRSDETNGGGEMATLTATPDRVAPGASVTAAWTGSTHEADWIGLFPVYAPDDAPYLDWSYTNCQQAAGDPVPEGSCSFTMPAEPGEYDLRLFANNSLNKMAASGPVTVAEQDPEPEPEPEPGWVKVFIPAWIRENDVVRVTQVVMPAKKGSRS